LCPRNKIVNYIGLSTQILQQIATDLWDFTEKELIIAIRYNDQLLPILFLSDQSQGYGYKKSQT
jgi:hypothetical protein